MISHVQRWKYAFRVFFSLIFKARIAEDILAAFRPTPAAAVVTQRVDSSDRATQVLALLQRDGRLVDFLMEDLTTYSDAQVGAAARDVHSGCRAALSRYLTLTPVLDDEEGASVVIEQSTDPARVKLVGNVAGTPQRGILRHRGWEATRVELPPLPGAGRAIVAPAEVEIG